MYVNYKYTWVSMVEGGMVSDTAIIAIMRYHNEYGNMGRCECV